MIDLSKKKNTKSKGNATDMQQTNRVLTEEEQATLDLLGEKLEEVPCGPQEEMEQVEDEASLEEAIAQTAETEAAEALEAALAKQEEYLNMAQRVQADFENYRRRNQNVRKEAYEDGASALICTLLPVVDNMERAIESAASSPDASLREGIEMVYRQLMEVFEKRGITTIDRQGQVFDPNLENAVMQAAPEDGEPGTVSEVLQKGYQLGDVVLRHAMVKVVPQ